MAYSIPDDIIEKVRERADIVEIIGDHVPLRQSGKNFKALCPFHPEQVKFRALHSIFSSAK